jgi:hypothetical protein
MTADEIRESVRSGTRSPNDALHLVEEALRSSASSALWVLRGDLIQLADSAPYDPGEAANSYHEAHRLAPDDPEPLEELGRFYDAVMPDRAESERYYRAALTKGAGQDCARALAELLAQP